MATSIETKIANETKELLIKACTYSTTTKHLDTWQKGEILDNDVKDIPEKFGNIIKFPTSGVKPGDMGLYLIIHEPSKTYVYLGRACPGDISSRISKVRSILTKAGGKSENYPSDHHQGASKMWEYDPVLSNYRYAYITYANKKDCTDTQIIVLQLQTKIAEDMWYKKLTPIYNTEGMIGT